MHLYSASTSKFKIIHKPENQKNIKSDQRRLRENRGDLIRPNFRDIRLCKESLHILRSCDSRHTNLYKNSSDSVFENDMGNEGVDSEQVHVQDLSAGDILRNIDDFGLNIEE